MGDTTVRVRLSVIIPTKIPIPKRFYCNGQTVILTTQGPFSQVPPSQMAVGGLSRLLTPEGYVDKSGTAYNHYYYLKDYQGNNRMVLNSSGAIVQATNYYAFGASYAEKPARTDQYVQPYKFGGKELDRMFGLDLYDNLARTYDPISSRFLTMDPMAELTPDISPYVFCENNPVNLIDPTGMSTHTDSLGNVVAVYNDNDMTVYRHNTLPSSYATYEGETETYVDADGNTQTREKGRLTGGENMGETEYWDEFRGHDEKTGAVLSEVEKNSRIIFGESWEPVIGSSNARANQDNLSTTAVRSLPNGAYDIKNNKSIAEYGPVTGRLLNGKYATARSAGNYLAGLNGATGKFMGMYISLETYMGLAGGLHAFKNNTNPYIAPYYGEVPYAGRRIVSGFNYGLKLRH